ncbi:chromatin modification-related protein YNG2 [Colletotrichum spaethianum]|uniref:Chromatin modification-related protein n=1 Tax=Colletotrichum spaethianum TaxID=700344 RepID=A0AA37P9Y3_9PEZI|nr:chromatin modification-related protein YNG2 [Colletotrichum spaethianum]GKT48354.1 chromatin modification-related protein YNG2 [Colletotrichum spaethianum]
MPRDDLSIDFVKRMPTAEALDPAIILDDWLNRVQNLPEEIRFLQDEIADRDRQYHDCVKLIEDRDGKIQKWIRANGSHETNPREETMRSQMRDNFIRADTLATEKIALTQKLQIIMDKHLRNLDQHIKMLYDRAEPGFNDPDECPSLIRPSAANHSAPSSRSVNPASHLVGTAITATPLNPIINSSSPTTARVGNPQIRNAQSQQHASSAPATPAASMILNRQARESSAGPGNDEAGDDKKYCTCQNVSFGDMVACDNEDCPYEWFHWSCVGLKSEPNGTWFCPVCTENMEKEKLQKKK